MKDKVLKRMKQEITDYRSELVSGKMTAEQIVEQSYQFVVKQGLYHIFANHNVNKMSADIWNWLDSQEHVLNYLYELWMHDDTDLTEEFAQIIQNELIHEMEVHGVE